MTKGFRHILHLAEAWTPGPLFGFMVYEKPEPLTDTRYVREVPERTGADGSIIEPLDEDAVRVAVEELVADGVEALTVCLLNAHANGRHERVIAEIAASVAPDLPISISSEILPEFREYERTVTTLMNAYVAPALEKYLTNVRDGLAAAQVRAPIQVVRSDGGSDEPRGRVQEPGPDRSVRSCRRCQRRVVRRVLRGLRPHPHLRHGWDLDGRRRVRVRAAGDHARDERRRLPGARPGGRRRQHRRRRRLDRLRRRGDGASGSAPRAPVPCPALPAMAAAARARP